VNAALTFIQKNPAQRVAVFVDVSNMYHSARNIYNSHLDFGAALKAAVGERQLVRAIAYAIKAESKDEEGFFNALTKQGFELKVKELQTFAGGAKKGDWDMGIAIDAIKIAPKVDAVVLVSGDGDYSVLLEHIKTMGCRVEVMAFSESASHLLLKVADDFTDLSQNKKVFLRRIVRRR
jgi:uncharacterized LabA/DUF88 family protein